MRLKTVEPQEIPIKVWVLCCNAVSDWLYRDCQGKKQVFLHLFNLPKCIAVGLLMEERLFSLLFYCDCVFGEI